MFNIENYMEEFEDEAYRRPRKKPKQSRADIVSQLVEAGDDTRTGFNPTFSSSKHEREWILNYLGGFYEDHLISDVLRQVKGGKEATVYCCAAGDELGVELVAAKVYRPRMFRNLRNDSLYRLGRDFLDEQGNRGRREVLAMKKGTGFGQDLRHVSWLSHEFTAMQRLHAQGADIPAPYARSDNVILMEYIGTESMAAPVLNSVSLEAGEAQPLFERLMWNIELMLANDLVHGDLSAHNVLYWQGDATIIDFPQAVDPYTNSEAYTLLERDVQRLCQYFLRQGVKADASALTRQMWVRCIPT